MGSSSQPKPPTVGETIGQITQAMPALYGAEATYNPLFTGLNLAGMNDSLYGTDAVAATESGTASQSGWYDAQGTLIRSGQGSHNSAGDNAKGVLNVLSGGMPGLVGGLFGKKKRGWTPPPGAHYVQKGGSLNNGKAAIGAHQGLIGMYGGAQQGVHNANMAQNPQMFGLLNTLNDRAASDLALGNQMNAGQTRMVQQSARAGQAARGLGMGPADVYGETLMQQGYGDQLLQQRNQFAQQMFGLNQSQQAQEGGQAMSMLGQNAFGVQNSNPMAGLLGYAHDNNMTAYNGAVSNANSTANNNAALGSAAIGVAGTVAVVA